MTASSATAAGAGHGRLGALLPDRRTAGRARPMGLARLLEELALHGRALKLRAVLAVIVLAVVQVDRHRRWWRALRRCAFRLLLIGIAIGVRLVSARLRL